MKKTLLRSTACLLAILMLLSTVSCGMTANKHASLQLGQTENGTTSNLSQNAVGDSASVGTTVSDIESATREELEQMLVALSKGAFTLADAMVMSDKELKEKVQMLLDQLENGNSSVDLIPEGYDEDGALTKPFDQRELMACINALLRRQGGQVDEMVYGNTALDLSTGMLVCGVYDESSKDYVEQMKAETDYYIYDFKELPELTF